MIYLISGIKILCRLEDAVKSQAVLLVRNRSLDINTGKILFIERILYYDKQFSIDRSHILSMSTHANVPKILSFILI